MKKTKKKLEDFIEYFGMGVDHLMTENEEIFTFTTCSAKDYLKVKKLLDKVEIDYNEEFETDGGDPYFMFEVESDKLKEYIS